MKKFLYSLGIIALMASCTEDYKDWADLKVNPAEDAKSVVVDASSNLAVDFGAEDLAEVLDLAQVTVTAADAYTADYAVEVSNADGSATKAVTIQNVTEDNVLQVKSEDLLNAVKALYGQTGEAENVLINVLATVKIGGEAFLRSAQTSISALVPKPEFEEYIYGIGNGTGWSRVCPLRSPNFDGLYTGYIYIDGEFKFRSHEDSWDAPDWGGGATPGTLAEGGNVTDPVETGYYAITVDLAKMTYELGTKITTIGIIGGFNGWASDYAKLEYNAATGAWEGEAELTAGTEFKFRANDDWAINWGGSMSELTQDGSNLTVDADGTYKIQLFAFCDGKAHAVLTLK